MEESTLCLQKTLSYNAIFMKDWYLISKTLKSTLALHSSSGPLEILQYFFFYSDPTTGRAATLSTISTAAASATSAATSPSAAATAAAV
jgi:hypothetical protein